MKRLAVEVTGLSVCTPYQGYVLILKEREGQRWLPIFIGAAEAQNISLLLQGLKYIRPLTYDLFFNILDATGSKIEQITITELRDNTFYAEVCLQCVNKNVRAIDARPSDAIALAIKAQAPIFVNARVMEEAGLIGETSESPPETSSITEELRQLNAKLNDAVQREAYEDAAKIRDQIRELEMQVRSS